MIPTEYGVMMRKYFAHRYTKPDLMFGIMVGGGYTTCTEEVQESFKGLSLLEAIKRVLHYTLRYHTFNAWSRDYTCGIKTRRSIQDITCLLRTYYIPTLPFQDVYQELHNNIGNKICVYGTFCPDVERAVFKLASDQIILPRGIYTEFGFDLDKPIYRS